MLALDDAQHCDELSLRWLEFLLRRSADRPLLLVLARQSEATALTRGVPTHHALADLTADCRTTTLRLSTLTERDVAEVVRSSSGARRPVFVTRARAATGGNPASWADCCANCGPRGRAGVGGADRIAETAGRVLAGWARELLDRQPSWIGEVARAVAVLGERGADHVGPLAGVPADAVEDARKVLCEAGLVPSDGRLAEGRRARRCSRPGRPRAVRPARAGGPAPERCGPARRRGRRPPPAAALDRRTVDAGRPAGGRGLRRGAWRAGDRGPLPVPGAGSGPRQHRHPRPLSEGAGRHGPARGGRPAARGAGTERRRAHRARIAAQFGTTGLAARECSVALKILEDVLDALDAELGPDPAPADRELRTLVEAVFLIVGSTAAAPSSRPASGPRRWCCRRATPPPSARSWRPWGY
ncbi:hypothetical protein O1L55_31825 [Streptomyces albulus]|nr:hypothetical protein [Streptomyces noursei]